MTELEILVPNWLATKLIERFGSLDAASQWYGCKIVDSYWHGLAVETQEKVNRDGP